MSSAINRVRQLTVADVMTRYVVAVSANATLDEASHILSRHQISGAPVIDEYEHCVGVISTSDLAENQFSCNDELITPLERDFHVVTQSPSGAMQAVEQAKPLVRDRMSSATQTIGTQQKLLEAARYMLGEHIHRLIVLDDHAHPIGVVSSLDVVAALVNSIDEAESI